MAAGAASDGRRRPFVSADARLVVGSLASSHRAFQSPLGPAATTPLTRPRGHGRRRLAFPEAGRVRRRSIALLATLPGIASDV